MKGTSLFNKYPHTNQRERGRFYFLLSFQFKGVRDLQVEEDVDKMFEVVVALRALKKSYGINQNRVTGEDMAIFWTINEPPGLQGLTTIFPFPFI